MICYISCCSTIQSNTSQMKVDAMRSMWEEKIRNTNHNILYYFTGYFTTEV